jgi:CubicO group peptidase (beta-lactamase class C family)
MRNLLLLFVYCIINSGGFAQSQNHFKKSLPEEQGLNSEVFADAIQKLKEDGTNIHSLLVIKNNRLVVDVAFYPFNNNYVHDLASVTKSQIALLIGIAIDKQFIQHENIPILTYFPEYKNTNDTLQKVTIKDLLNMSSGFDCGKEPGEKELYDMRNTDDWAAFMLRLPFVSLPDEAFSYCSGNFYLLAEILQRATKMTCHQFAEKYLFKPLNFGKTYWPKNDKGVNYGWGDLHISIYDFAKIGVLILNEGEWNGKQIISKEWIKKIQPAHKAKGTESYGYGWWFDSENPDGIQAMGRGGQRIFIYRKSKMIVATFGGGGYDSGYLDDPAFKALKEYEKGEKQNTALQQQIIKASLPDTQWLTNTKLPEEHLNKTFLLDKNELGIKSIRFKKNKMNYSLSIHSIDNSKETHPLTLDGKINLSKERTFGLPMALKGKWADDMLYIEYNRLTRIENFNLTIQFKPNNTLELKITEASKEINQSITGHSLW